MGTTNIKNNAKNFNTNQSDRNVNSSFQKGSSKTIYTLPIDHPSTVKYVYVDKSDVEIVIKQQIKNRIEIIANKVKSVHEIFKRFESVQVVIFENNYGLWADMKVGGLYPTVPFITHHRSNYDETVSNISYLIDSISNTYGLIFEIPYEQEIRESFSEGKDSPCSPHNSNYVIRQIGGNLCCYHRVICREQRQNEISTIINCKDCYAGIKDKYEDYAFIPVARFWQNFGKTGIFGLMRFCLSNNVLPMNLREEEKESINKFVQYYKILQDYLMDESEEECLNKSKLYNHVINGIFKNKVFEYTLDYSTELQQIISGKQTINNIEEIKKFLKDDDHKRANLLPYPENYLFDVNMGLWELFENKENDSNFIKLALKDGKQMVARPPQLDIVDGGVCAIDFGTKSTVVACFETETRLQRIGMGRYDQAVSEADYQNPTVMQIIDFEAFMKAYTARKGRPFTAWKDLTVSHQAAQQLIDNEDDSSVYNSIFSELKQWANDKKRRLQLVDRKGKSIDVKPYLQLNKDDFDPIEVYAYYLGLYINNIYKKIYLDYILSFPVNYEKDVRDKLLSSFTAGLKKSLPPAIVADIDDKKLDFRVYAGASEPAAYAVSALEFYKLEPEKPKDRVCYGVFDFGGGTTDFDFGIEEYCERKYQYQIKQFGKGGDVYLGGENILALMAYQVYKENFSKMSENNIPFVIPPKAVRFAGSESLVYDSDRAPREAFLNLRKLAEALRPLWENKAGANVSEIKSIKLYVLAKNNKDAVAKVVNPVIKKESLDRIIEGRIKDGVSSFFKAYIDAFAKYMSETKVPIHIFLAGNSSKHPKVKELFEKAIAAEEKQIQEGYKKRSGQDAGKTTTFILHEPLNNTGSEQDYELLHNGKTGVVFGLVRSRKGGNDVKIVDMNQDTTSGEITFPYYLGRINRKGKFECIIPIEIPYNQWCEFNYADYGDEDFELFYTEQARCLTGAMLSKDVKKVNCRFDQVRSQSDNLNIYIRKSKPDTIEYTVGTEEQINSNKNVKIYLKILQK